MATQQEIESAWGRAYHAKLKVKDEPVDGQGRVIAAYRHWQQVYANFEVQVAEAKQNDAWAGRPVQEAYQQMGAVGINECPTRNPPPVEEDGPFRDVVRQMQQCWQYYQRNPAANRGFWHGAPPTANGAQPDGYRKVDTDLVRILDIPGALGREFFTDHSHETGRLAIHRVVAGRPTFVFHL